MKKIVLTTSIITTLGVANNFVNYNLLTNNSIEENNNLKTNNSLCNNSYQLLNTTTVVANQTKDNKFYSYDLKEFTGNLSDGTDPKTLFFVDLDGALQFKSGAEAKIPQIDHQNILNTKKSIEENKKIVTVSQPIDWTRSYYNKSGYFSNNWQYLQLGGIENHIDISRQLDASLVTYSNDLSESWGLYYIAQAVRNKKIDIKIGNDLANYFISKSTLKDSIKNLSLAIMNLLETNDTFYNFIGNAPFSNSSINYYCDLVFDNDNNLISATYSIPNNVGQVVNEGKGYSYNSNIALWDNSNCYKVLNWSNYATNWENFIQLYPNFFLGETSHIEVAANITYWFSASDNFFYVNTSSQVKTSNILVSQGSGDANEVIRAGGTSSDNSLFDLDIWHDNQYIYFEWFFSPYPNGSCITQSTISLNMCINKFIFIP